MEVLRQQPPQVINLPGRNRTRISMDIHEPHHPFRPQHPTCGTRGAGSRTNTYPENKGRETVF